VAVDGLGATAAGFADAAFARNPIDTAVDPNGLLVAAVGAVVGLALFHVVRRG
jgi:uncharacterized membrane protein YeaQ/YmgE (transglycosylase-associated protein family)